MANTDDPGQDLPLSGRWAVVTGATRGIGQAIAKELIVLGARVLGTGRGPRPAHLLPQLDYQGVDLTDRPATLEFAHQLRQLEPDILINNAGINRLSPFAELALEDLEDVLNVNFVAPFILTQAVTPSMAKRGWGRVVNISSVWGKVSREYRAAYSASKFALDGMTVAVAAEITRYGVLLNCVAPGFIDTNLTRSTLDDARIGELVEAVPARRLGTVEEVARFVCWLAGPENTYISAQNIAIDGGFTRV